MLYKRSSELFVEAIKYIPGGVNSPVRAFKSVGGTPIFIKKAIGAYLFDEDDKRYIDYINSWGPMILGHAYQPVVDAVIEKTKLGTSFGTPTAIETEIAKLAVSMVPNIDKIRFVNSGTEACMSAVRLARGYTKREKIIKFRGCYHGHSDSFLIAAGSGLSTFGVPSSPGVTKGTAQDTLLANFNDLNSVKELFEANKNEIAAIIIEPVAGNMGCVPPVNNFLQELRAICDKNGTLLIFDEVMTGFRLAKGGAQELFNVQADIVCFGKVIGGGLPVGAFAARAEIMDYLAPVGPVYQAGTLSGNPLAMAAGLAMLQAINNDTELFNRLEAKTAYLETGIRKVLTANNKTFTINRVGSMISIFFCENHVENYEDASKADTPEFRKFFHDLLERGIYIAPSSYETWFITDALSYEDLDETIQAINEATI
ncbi:glutamate-1-semialdehyde 2,1-aminomutase [Flavobacterium sp. CBA20B-1]|uniref:glutamate-1-semialdehyde 2,1-aminomutase n=1 Tax=unclassified Flavobacterium TaxID=196869 RepID=UPI00222525F3|nr:MULTISPECIES: glutamate-1-semialdehyde 2,1-aminomutase [unclassified Flavobacterium]WCM41065.1 glutamate-1-semialdehyde 2,1-aminomutase [Flavobacterium sp. CBA20B-1]